MEYVQKYWVDALFVLFELIIVVSCGKKGFFKTLMKLAKFVLAVVASYLFAPKALPYVKQYLTAVTNETILLILSYIVVFIAALIALSIVCAIIGKMIESTVIIRALDVLLGVVVGGVLGFAVLMLAASLMKSFEALQPYYENSIIPKWIVESDLLEKFKILDIGKEWIDKLGLKDKTIQLKGMLTK